MFKWNASDADWVELSTSERIWVESQVVIPAGGTTVVSMGGERVRVRRFN